MELTKEKLEKSILKRVGAFRIFQSVLLGEGTFGTVYLASMNSEEKTISLSQTFYAAKAINKKDIDPKKLSRFEEAISTEISILRALNHQSIVKLIDVRSTENRFYLIFEYCSGGTLEAYRKKKQGKVLMEEESREIVKQIAEAMIFCLDRETPIIHRDLKPANILMMNGMVKISDFGFARIVENNSEKLKLTINIGKIWEIKVLWENENLLKN